jgi:hypothetical protein
MHMEAAKKPFNAASATVTHGKNITQPMPVKPAVKAEMPKPPEQPNFKPASGADRVGAEPKADTKPVASAAPGLTPAIAVKAEQKEKLGTKLRRKGDILKVLRGGGHLVHTTEGLYRIVAADKSQNPVSKRRVAAMIAQKLLKPTDGSDGRTYRLDPEADKKASAPKTEAKAPQTAPVPADHVS